MGSLERIAVQKRGPVVDLIPHPHPLAPAPEDVFVHEMGMAESYNPDMEKSKEYRKWLKALEHLEHLPLHFMARITIERRNNRVMAMGKNSIDDIIRYL